MNVAQLNHPGSGHCPPMGREGVDAATPAKPEDLPLPLRWPISGGEPAGQPGRPKKQGASPQPLSAGGFFMAPAMEA